VEQLLNTGGRKFSELGLIAFSDRRVIFITEYALSVLHFLTVLWFKVIRKCNLQS